MTLKNKLDINLKVFTEKNQIFNKNIEKIPEGEVNTSEGVSS